MLKIGKTMELQVVKQVDFGIYLAENEDPAAERVLLPKKQVPPGTVRGSRLSVFLYKDSSDRLIATTAVPALQLGQIALLKVAAVGKIGAFLKWGLEKDLFLPFKEQTRKVSEGEEVLAALYTDKSGRLCATMRLHPYLHRNPPYAVGDMVAARIYDIHPKYGLFLAVADQYGGLIPKKDAQGNYRIGDRLMVRIVQIREDGRIDASPKQKAYLQLEDDARAVFRKLEEYGGILPFDDHASPEQINDVFGLSKAAFKRAVGHLLKERRIVLEDGKIKLS